MNYGDFGYDADRYGDDGDDESTTRSATGRASVRSGGPFGSGVGAGPVKGSASVGSASVGSASVGQAGVGRATVGRATAPADDVPTGRAQVGANGDGVLGRASVGRATVRAAAPVAPAIPGVPGMPGELPDIGPDVVEGPGERSRRSLPKPRLRLPRSKKIKRRNWIIAGFATFIMLAGLLVVGGTYFWDAVPLPESLAQPEATTIYYSSGEIMAKIGTENRTLIPFDQMPPDVQHAVIAAEDRSFYDNKGVDFKGVMRAAWNNFTGGEIQGASTITQQYARNVAELKGISYSRKLREAVIAMKLNDQYSKDQIMTFYLNTVYFGRGAYGLEAAAQAYFGKNAVKLDTAEGMVLAGLIKNPGGDGSSGSPFDPTRHKDTAVDRWNYIRDTMLQLKDRDGKPFLTEDRAKTLKYPETVRPANNNDPLLAGQFGLDKPTGLVVHHVMDELSHLRNGDGSMGLRDKQGQPYDIKNGGLKIITTIDKKAQDAAEAAANETTPGSVMNGQPPNLRAALVAVEPYTGRVRAYYGASSGAGFDMAGWYADPVMADGQPSGGNHPPGSTFKIYTLGAALKAGISIDSYWLGPKVREFPKSGRTLKSPAGPIRNSGGSCEQGCQLWYGLEQSMNTVFFAVGERVGAAKVIEFAKAAGIRSMWAAVKGEPAPKRIDLAAIKSGSEVSPTYFNTEVSIGQYGVTVMDHANGAATLAARGMAATEHFVQSVSKGTQLIYGESVNPKQIDGYTQQMADDEAWAMQQVIASGTAKSEALAGGRPAAGKTGTWQLGNTTDNAHAWFVGFTASDAKQKGLAAAVWVGNKGNEQKIVDKNGKAVAGAGLPGLIWKKFMDATLKGQRSIQFPEAKHVGDDTGEVSSPTPSLPPTDGGGPGPGTDPCQLPQPLCPSPKPSRSSGGGGGGGGGFPTPTPRRTH
jgi:membrane peptidoglycan carboxypeptidase